MKKPNRNSKKKKERHENAAARQVEYKKLSKEEKITNLDNKLGKGKGAEKQRKKLSK